jgi:hypothetical protein
MGREGRHSAELLPSLCSLWRRVVSILSSDSYVVCNCIDFSRNVNRLAFANS